MHASTIICPPVDTLLIRTASFFFRVVAEDPIVCKVEQLCSAAEVSQQLLWDARSWASVQGSVTDSTGHLLLHTNYLHRWELSVHWVQWGRKKKRSWDCTDGNGGEGETAPS